jgi:hypothetical protein
METVANYSSNKMSFNQIKINICEQHMVYLPNKCRTQIRYHVAPYKSRLPSSQQLSTVRTSYLSSPTVIIQM